MPTQLNLVVDVSVAEALREKAGATGAGISELATLCLKFGLDRLRDDAVRLFVEKRKPRRRTAFTKNERLTLEAFDRLTAREPGASRWSLGTIASEAGLRLTLGFWALKGLQARGLVIGAELEETDRWGRPIRSFWRRVSDSKTSG